MRIDDETDSVSLFPEKHKYLCFGQCIHASCEEESDHQPKKDSQDNPKKLHIIHDSLIMSIIH